jgi:flagellar export protein FliJ
MGRFSFRLEKVLRYRAHLEKKVRLQFSEAMNRMKDQETLIVRLGNRKIEAARALAEERSEGISVSMDRIHASFLCGLGERIEEEGRALEKAREKFELLRNLMAAAATKRRSLESLKDLLFARFREDLQRREQKILDDLVLIAIKREGS